MCALERARCLVEPEESQFVVTHVCPQVLDLLSPTWSVCSWPSSTSVDILCLWRPVCSREVHLDSQVRMRRSGGKLHSVFFLVALLEAVGLELLSATTTSVTFRWAWQRKSGPIRVSRYRVELRRSSQRKGVSSSWNVSGPSTSTETSGSPALPAVVSLWWDQQSHTFSNLTPSTEYALVLLADDASRAIVTVATQSGQFLQDFLSVRPKADSAPKIDLKQRKMGFHLLFILMLGDD